MQQYTVCPAFVSIRCMYCIPVYEAQTYNVASARLLCEESYFWGEGQCVINTVYQQHHRKLCRSRQITQMPHVNIITTIGKSLCVHCTLALILFIATKKCCDAFLMFPFSGNYIYFIPNPTHSTMCWVTSLTSNKHIVKECKALKKFNYIYIKKKLNNDKNSETQT